jgi:hypothetical protein
MNADQNIEMGDLVIVQHATYHEEWKGSIGVVTVGLSEQRCMNLHTMQEERFSGYEVRLPDGRRVSAEPCQLRKIIPPDDAGNTGTATTRNTKKRCEVPS